MATIAILGTMDSKGVEHAFVADQIRLRGHKTLVIDVGTMGEPKLKPNITREEVALAGGIDLRALQKKQDRGESVAAMSKAAPVVLAKLAAEGKIDGVISLGGGGETPALLSDDKPVIVASMFGNTTACVQHAQKILEQAGFEVLVFHATGTGGRIMESLIESGMVTGVLDITTTEWADELVGGILTAGPSRLEAAARLGVPAIVTPGCLDMVNFGPPDTVPEKFRGRNFYQHNPQVTLMRTTPEECAQLGRIIAEKLNRSNGPLTVLVPQKAISVISAPGQKFHDPSADKALFDALKTHLRKDIEVTELDCAINDTAFAEACAKALLRNLAARR